jgi:hypothetical protein
MIKPVDSTAYGGGHVVRYVANKGRSQMIARTTGQTSSVDYQIPDTVVRGTAWEQGSKALSSR